MTQDALSGKTALITGGALGVVGTRNVVHAALFLLASLMGVAGLYVLVFAELWRRAFDTPGRRGGLVRGARLAQAADARVVDVHEKAAGRKVGIGRNAPRAV